MDPTISSKPISVIGPENDIELAPIKKDDSVLATKPNDPFLVEFDATYDAENPKDWPTSKKWAVTDVLSATGFIRIMVSTIMAPALSTIAKELDMSSTESAMALSIYLLATAFGPVFIGPLSEIYGRKRVLHASNIWFLVWNIACGFANTKEVLIASRFMAGFGASSIYALAGGVLGDIWRPDQRGRSLGIYLLIPLLAVAVGVYTL
jgi:MFS family permease